MISNLDTLLHISVNPELTVDEIQGIARTMVSVRHTCKHEGGSSQMSCFTCVGIIQDEHFASFQDVGPVTCMSVRVLLAGIAHPCKAYRVAPTARMTGAFHNLPACMDGVPQGREHAGKAYNQHVLCRCPARRRGLLAGRVGTPRDTRHGVSMADARGVREWQLGRLADALANRPLILRAGLGSTHGAPDADRGLQGREQISWERLPGGQDPFHTAWRTAQQGSEGRCQPGQCMRAPWRAVPRSQAT